MAVSTRRQTRRHLTAATVVSAALALAACGGDADGDTGTGGGSGANGDGNGSDLVELNVGVIPIIDVAPLYLGIEQGIFEEHGLEVVPQSGQGGAAIVPGVVSGELQLGFGNSMSVVVASSTGLPLRIVASGVWTNEDPDADPYTIMSADEGITAAADLEGTTVAVNTVNSSGDSAIIRTVREAGGDPDTIEFVEMPFDSMPAAMANGDVDAAWIVEPFVTLALDEGAHVVYPLLLSLADEFEVSTYFTVADWAADNPDTLAAFQDAIAEANAYANSNPDEVRRILDTYLELPGDLTDRVRLPSWQEDVSTDTVQIYHDLAEDRGLLPNAVDLDQLLELAR